MRGVDSLRKRTVARWCSTKWGSFRRRSRRSCCERSREARSSRSAPLASSTRTCASSLATNRDLAAEVRAGRFREDLYYRLAVLELLVLPSRAPRRHPCPGCRIRRQYGMRFGDEGVRLSPALVEALCRAHWPGNVRQLENAVARMVALRSASEIGVDAFGGDPDFVASTAPCIELESRGTLSEKLEALERRIIARVMDAVAGNQSEAARRLGLNRGSLIGRLKKYGSRSPASASSLLGAARTCLPGRSRPWRPRRRPPEASFDSSPTSAAEARPPEAPGRSDSEGDLEDSSSSPDQPAVVLAGERDCQ